MRIPALGLALGLMLGLAGPSFANDLAASEVFTGTVVGFQTQQSYANMTLRVTGPNQYQASAAFPSGSPAIDLAKYGAVSDGTYNYHLAGTNGEVVLGSSGNAGRPANTTSPYKLKTVSKSGSFTIQGGAIVSKTTAEPKRTR